VRGKRRVIRQSAAARFLHWTHTISCLLLFYTGLALYLPRLNGLAAVFGGLDGSRFAHRVCGVFFIGIPILMIIFNWRGFVNFLKDIFTWEENDTTWLLRFPIYLFRAKTKMPPQGRLKSGQKFADWFIIGSSILLILTGIAMAFPANFPKGLVQWCFPLHELGMIILGVFLLGHIYLGLGIFQPYRGAWRYMFGDGTVSEEEAKYHWTRWYEEVKGKEST